MRVVGSRMLAGLVLALLSASIIFAYEMDDTIPEVTDRVARISFLRGDVQIRRDGSQDWEKAELNLPIVEGDEIAVENGGRLEIQFSKDKHLRVDEGSLVQVRQLSDSGVAVSVTRGVVSLRLRKLDLDNEFFEIDGPGTTVAMQKSGTYRFDAGRDDGSDVNISVTGGGEARIYSASSGFSLRSGRAATVFIEGDRPGEWEMSDASRFDDEFTAWADDRDSVIDKALAGAHYDKYYDQDIYGAEELNAHGDWEYTSDYGYIWQPYQRSISGYNDWSPYRYGSWRWVPPFGWTWVNAEPWGWATYHYGRWIWYRGRWVWTPYSYYRTNRSWWYPALVVVQVINRNVCWYPLGWGRRYYNYNHGYHDWIGNRDRRRGGGRDRDRDRDRDPRPGTSPTPTNGPVAVRERVPMPIERVPGTDPNSGGRERKPKDTPVPPTGVISIPADSFGVSRRIGAIAPPEMANTILKKIDAGDRTPVELPTYQAVRTKIARDISTTPPEVVRNRNFGVRVGASDRKIDVPLDQDLRRTRILGDRQPLPQPVERVVPANDGAAPPRRTGAVTRDPMPRRDPQVSPVERRTDTPPVVTPKPDVPRREIPRPSDDTPRVDQMPRRDPPKPREDAPRRDPIKVPRQETPRPEPQPRRDPPKPREDAPRKDPPRRESSPPERKSAPPKTERPAPKSSAGPSRKGEPIT